MQKPSGADVAKEIRARVHDLNILIHDAYMKHEIITYLNVVRGESRIGMLVVDVVQDV